MSKTNVVAELYGFSIKENGIEWNELTDSQSCFFINKKCLKNRKSEPDLTIGACSVTYGRELKNVVICPHRFLERKQIFTDCIHLLTLHEPGNELHIISEVNIPGGSVDYFLVSVRDGTVKDFVGIELQALDTTGTVWPSRQRWLESKGIQIDNIDSKSKKSFGINWKMTAKTTLIQLHHKIETFEQINKHLVLVLQDHLLNYMFNEFNFDHLENARIGDSMHFHPYNLNEINEKYKLSLSTRKSTTSSGIAICLGLQAETKVELKHIIQQLQEKISKNTLFTL